MNSKTVLALFVALVCIEISHGGQYDEEVCQTTKLVLVLDRSYSIRFMDWQRVKDYANYLIKETKISSTGSRAGVVTFASTAQVLAQCSDHSSVESLQKAINDFNRHPFVNTATDIHDGLVKAEQVLNKCMVDQPGPKVVVVITDGNDNHGLLPGSKALELQQNGAEMFSIGVGSVSQLTLNDIASSPANTLLVNSFTELMNSDAFNEKLAAKLCQKKSTTTEVPPPTSTTTTAKTDSTTSTTESTTTDYTTSTESTTTITGSTPTPSKSTTSTTESTTTATNSTPTPSKSTTSTTESTTTVTNSTPSKSTTTEYTTSTESTTTTKTPYTSTTTEHSTTTPHTDSTTTSSTPYTPTASSTTTHANNSTTTTYSSTISTTKHPSGSCNCTSISEPICLSWGKKDIYFYFKGLCFADKLKLAIKYVEDRKHHIEKKSKTIEEECLSKYENLITEHGKNVFHQYKKCLLNVHCVNKEHLRRLGLKIEQLKRELDREEEKNNSFLGQFMSRVVGERSFLDSDW